MATIITTSTAARHDKGLPNVASQPANSILKRVRIGSRQLTPRLTYRRRGGWRSAEIVFKSPRATERKARAAVRCRCVVKPHA
jgi:hypothetical protein